MRDADKTFLHRRRLTNFSPRLRLPSSVFHDKEINGNSVTMVSLSFVGPLIKQLTRFQVFFCLLTVSRCGNWISRRGENLIYRKGFMCSTIVQPMIRFFRIFLHRNRGGIKDTALCSQWSSNKGRQRTLLLALISLSGFPRQDSLCWSFEVIEQNRDVWKPQRNFFLRHHLSIN